MNTSLLNLSSQVGGSVLGYTGTPGQGNLYFALSPVATTDNFGNSVATGITVQAGSISGVSIVGAVVDSTTNLVGSSIQQPTVLQPTVTGGTATSLVHVLNNGNGQVLGYVTGTNASTFATNGSYLWTAPTGVTTVRVQAWAAGGGAGGGNVNEGGEGGGGGEYAEEPSYSVTPGQVYQVVVGKGGMGAVAGQIGYPGGVTTFQPVQGGLSPVVANPGQGGANFIGGNGGTGSQNTIHFNGGNGASASGHTGGNGGGGSGGPTAPGNPGLQSSSSSGASGGSAVSGGGAGGAGGSSAVAGSAGSGPGGGSGGNGNSSSSVVSKTYQPGNGTYSYFGSDATNGKANDLRNHDGPLFQGLYGTTNFAGTQFSYMTLPYQQIQSDLLNATITHVTMTIKALGSYYSTGFYAYVQYSDQQTFGNTAPSGDNVVHCSTILIRTGQTITMVMGIAPNLGTSLQNGQASSFKFGPVDGLSNYGYLDSGANGGFAPEITVYYFIGGSTPLQAGNGADGKVIISYGNAPTNPSLNLAISSVSASDPYGHSFAQGFTGPQLTLSNQSTPSTVGSATAVFSNTGQLNYVSSSDGNVYSTGQLILPATATPQTINSTGAATVTGCTANTAVGAYKLKVVLQFTANQTGGSPSFQVGLSGSVSSQWGNGLIWQTSGSGAGTNRFTSNLTGLVFQGPAMVSAAVYFVQIEGYVNFTTTGAVSLQAFTSVGTDTYAINNAFFEVVPI